MFSKTTNCSRSTSLCTFISLRKKIHSCSVIPNSSQHIITLHQLPPDPRTFDARSKTTLLGSVGSGRISIVFLGVFTPTTNAKTKSRYFQGQNWYHRALQPACLQRNVSCKLRINTVHERETTRLQEHSLEGNKIALGICRPDKYTA